MNKEQLKARVEEYELIARAGKIKRMLHRPFNYLFGIIYREIFYKINRKGKLVTTPTFLNDSVNIVLPACMDIYITGGKSHDSEIRLTKFLVNQLNEGDTFLDVGAHIGFFSLLAAHIVSYTGKVIAVEASPTTFQLLKKNIASHKNIVAINKALSFENGKINFLEFPIIYSEFNTLETSQYENEEWFKKIKPTIIEVEAIKADDLLNERTPPQV